MVKISRNLVIVVVLAAVLVAGLMLGFTHGKVIVRDVIDGDTFEDNDGTRYRLIGINTPEKGELCYEDAKNFLTSKIIGKEIEITKYGKEKYGRLLVEAYYNGENINRALLAAGLANAYYSAEEGILWGKYLEAEKEGRERAGCMWKPSPIKECIDGKRDVGYFILSNKCGVAIDAFVVLRDTSASHRLEKRLYIAPYEDVEIREDCGEDDEEKIHTCEHIFNNEGDELIIYDKEGLVVFVPYGVYSR